MGSFRAPALASVRAGLSTVSLATLPPEQRTDGTSLFNLSRNSAPASASRLTAADAETRRPISRYRSARHGRGIGCSKPTIAQFWENPATDAGAPRSMHDHAQAQIIGTSMISSC